MVWNWVRWWMSGGYHLDGFVAEPKNDGMLGLQPTFDEHERLVTVLCISKGVPSCGHCSKVLELLKRLQPTHMFYPSCQDPRLPVSSSLPWHYYH